MTFIICLLLLICIFALLANPASGVGYKSVIPPGCDEVAALQCEYEFLLCKLFHGPANDPETLCYCASIFYGSCLRMAGCETAREVGPLTKHQIYMKTCVDFIMTYNCPNSLICAINCASNTTIDQATTKIIPFNNYGQKHLRIRTCLSKVHDQRLQRYSTIQQVACSSISDFEVCSRWIPPSTYVPVALPIDTTYIEIDSCTITSDGERDVYSCPDNVQPARVYGNSFLFPNSFEVPPNKNSFCTSNDDCLGSFCQLQFHPSICSPKTIQQALGTGKDYYSTTTSK